VVLFDFDGTLFDLEVDWTALRASLPLDRDETLGAAIQRFKDDGDPVLDTITTAEVEAVGDRRLDPAVVATLRELGDRFALAVCTRNSRAAVLAAIEGTGLEATLSVVGREDVARLKPDPEAVEVALTRFGARANQAVLVGDTYHDVEAARAAGTGVVVLVNPRLARVPEGADHYVKVFTGLPQLLTGVPRASGESR
jgi:phosphoglycolate phosphatase